MNITQNARSAIVEQIVVDPIVVRILRATATRRNIDWEDLRQALALRLLRKDDHLTELPVRVDLIHTEIKSIAINLYRQTPQGRLDRLGERRKQEMSDGGSGRVSKNCVTFISPDFDHEDARRPIEEVFSRLFIEEAIYHVPAQSRDLFLKRIVDEMTFPEIAARSGKQLEQIKKQWRSHFPRLCEILQKELV